jgi:hypothetical protein
MSQIMFSVVDQDLYITNEPTIASGDVTVDQAVFSFESDDWDGRVKTAVFFADENEPYYKLLDEHGACYIPSEVMAAAGKISIGVFGVKDQTILTSRLVSYKIFPGALTQATEGVTPELWDQILNKYNVINDAIDALVEDQTEIMVSARAVVQQVYDALAAIHATVEDMDGGVPSTSNYTEDIDAGSI